MANRNLSDPLSTHLSAPEAAFQGSLRLLYRVAAALFLCAFLIVSVRISQFGWTLVFGVQIFCIVTGLWAAVSAKLVTPEIRVFSMTGAFFGVGVCGLLQFGLTAPAHFTFVLAPLIAATTLSKRQTLTVFTISLVLLGLTATYFVQGQGRPLLEHEAASLQDPRNWISSILAIGATGAAQCLLVLQLRHLWERSYLGTIERHKQMSALVQHAPEGIAILDADTGLLLQINPAAAQLFGIPPDEPLVEEGFLKFCPEFQPEGQKSQFVLQENFKAALAGELPKLDWQLRSSTGRKTRVDLSLAKLPSNEANLIRVGLTDMTELYSAYEEVRQTSFTDTLTGLPNRRQLTVKLAEILPHTKSSILEVAVIVLDLDRLKLVNNRFGHFSGDRIIAQTAIRLNNILTEDAFLARTAGDEFVIMLKGKDVEASARALAQQALDALSPPFQLGTGAVFTSASIGFALSSHVEDQGDWLLSAADQAMHHAKSQGGNRLCMFNSTIGEQARDRHSLISDLMAGLDDNALTVHYQPVVHLKTGRIAKVEALARWTHPTLGPIAPSRFIPLAEEAGLITQIGEVVRRQSLTDFPELMDHFEDPFQICLNVSPYELEALTPETATSWPIEGSKQGSAKDTDQQAGADPQFVLEITESALLGSDPALAAKLEDLRARGAKLALDDFGAGHSSLTYFLDHTFDYIKLDRAFIQRVNTTTAAHAVCETIFGFADRMGGSAIAEGIETPEQLLQVRALGCTYGQGFLFSPPLPKQKLLQLPPRLSLPEIQLA